MSKDLNLIGNRYVSACLLYLFMSIAMTMTANPGSCPVPFLRLFSTPNDGASSYNWTKDLSVLHCYVLGYRYHVPRLRPRLARNDTTEVPNGSFRSWILLKCCIPD